MGTSCDIGTCGDGGLNESSNRDYRPLQIRQRKGHGRGHDWAEGNADLTWVAGLTKVDTFHIAPDLGMAVFFFQEAEQAKTTLPELRKFFQGYSEMFDCKITWELGSYNLSLSQKLTSQGTAKS